MGKHTPEPWYAYQREHPVGYSFGICNSRPCGTLVDEDGSTHTDFPDWNPQTSEIIARTYDSEKSHANSHRIVACVNACVGMADPSAEIERLRACVAELEADNADFKKLIADELAETFRLFGAVGLNEADDFGTKTAIEAVRERIESIKADRDRWKTEALAARPFIDMGCIEAWQPDGLHPGIPTHIAYKAARAANGEVGQ